MFRAPPITLRQLRYFVAVVESTSYRKAAAQLHISQPPLTQQMQALERLLDVELFDREGRRVALTLAGQELLVEARRILAKVDEACAHVVATGRGLIGRLRIGMTDDFVGSTVVATLLSFIRANPGLDVETEIEDSEHMVSGVVDSTLDLALANRPLPLGAESLQQIELPSSRIVALMHRDHPLAAQSSLEVRDLEGVPLISLSVQSQLPFATRLRQLFENEQMLPRILHKTTSSTMALRLAEENFGVALLAEYSFGAVPATVTVRPFNCESATLHHVLLHPQRNLSPALSRLIEALVSP